jgi:hypothetical protein
MAPHEFRERMAIIADDDTGDEFCIGERRLRHRE